MRVQFILLFILFLAQSCATNDAIFELSPAQSMSITGLGVGQDAAKNPYGDTNSIGIIKNIGKNTFTIRVQDGGVIIELFKINPNEVKEVNLLQGYRLYLDSELKGKAKIEFKKQDV